MQYKWSKYKKLFLIQYSSVFFGASIVINNISQILSIVQQLKKKKNLAFHKFIFKVKNDKKNQNL